MIVKILCCRGITNRRFNASLWTLVCCYLLVLCHGSSGCDGRLQLLSTSSHFDEERLATIEITALSEKQQQRLKGNLGDSLLSSAIVRLQGVYARGPRSNADGVLKKVQSLLLSLCGRNHRNAVDF
jgi:hypothetical protein